MTKPFIPATISSQFDEIGQERIHMAPVDKNKRNIISVLPLIYFFGTEDYYVHLHGFPDGYDTEQPIDVFVSSSTQIAVLTSFDPNGPTDTDVLYFNPSDFGYHYPNEGDTINLSQGSWVYSAVVTFADVP